MRSRILATLAALFVLPSFASAQEVADDPSVILKGVPFQITVNGGTEAGQQYAWEILTATGRSLASGTVEAYASATALDMTVRSGDELPLQVRIGDSLLFVRQLFKANKDLVQLFLGQVEAHILQAAAQGMASAVLAQHQ